MRLRNLFKISAHASKLHTLCFQIAESHTVLQPHPTSRISVAGCT